MSDKTTTPALYGGPCPTCGTHSTVPCLRTDCGRLNKQGDYLSSKSQTTDRLPFWPWQVWRHFRTKLRNMEVRHARERAALTAWEIECWHYLQENQRG